MAAMTGKQLTRRRIVLAGGLLLIVAGIGWWYAQAKSAAKPPPAAPKLPVQVVRVQTSAMPVVIEAVGKVVPAASVEVRPQIAGVLKSVAIKDGERVAAGQLLFTLDAQPLTAAMAQMQAQLARDRALADDAASSAARLQPLAEKEYVTAKEYDAAVSNRRALRATAEATRAQVEQARLTLGFTRIFAPMAGRVGAVLVKPGNLVSSSALTPLAVINVLSPADVLFAVPQGQLAELRKAAADGTLTVQLRDSATRKLAAVGELKFIDNAVADTSGTIALKAHFGNDQEALWPGEFYSVRIILRTEPAALSVPEQSLQQGQAGPYLYVIDQGVAQGVAQGIAKVRQLKVDRILDGRAVVKEGLRGDETVVLVAPNNLRDGSTVEVVAAPARDDPALSTSPTSSIDK